METVPLLAARALTDFENARGWDGRKWKSKVGLAEARSCGEMDMETNDGGRQGKGERAVRRCWWVRVCMMLETRAKRSPRQ